MRIIPITLTNKKPTRILAEHDYIRGIRLYSVLKVLNEKQSRPLLSFLHNRQVSRCPLCGRYVSAAHFTNATGFRIECTHCDVLFFRLENELIRVFQIDAETRQISSEYNYTLLIPTDEPCSWDDAGNFLETSRILDKKINELEY